MTYEEKYKKLKGIFWDYDTEKLPLDKIIIRQYGFIDNYVFNLILSRMLERLNWYDLLDILSLQNVREFLTKETIDRLHFAELRDKYEFIRKVLSGENISFTGWGDEYYKKIKHTLFSNRWYSTKQTLL